MSEVTVTVPLNPSASPAVPAEDKKEEEPPKVYPFSKPLVYFKRNAPITRIRKHNDHPTQIVFPAGAMALGMQPTKDLSPARQREDEDLHDAENILVFTNADLERGKKLLCFMLFLIPLDFILITVAFTSGELNTDPAAQGYQLASQITYSTVLLNLVLALSGIFLRDARILALFIAVCYVECFVNFVRVHTYLMVGHFLVEVILLYTVNIFRGALVPNWFTPQR